MIHSAPRNYTNVQSGIFIPKLPSQVEAVYERFSTGNDLQAPTEGFASSGSSRDSLVLERYKGRPEELRILDNSRGHDLDDRPGILTTRLTNQLVDRAEVATYGPGITDTRGIGMFNKGGEVEHREMTRHERGLTLALEYKHHLLADGQESASLKLIRAEADHPIKVVEWAGQDWLLKD